jgi:quinol---cytochrome c reductase iron-sulfur subunit
MTGSQSDIPSEEELRAMSTEQAMLTAARSDDVHLVHRRNRFPVPGTKAEKRAERAVAACFVISALAGVGFIVAFIAAPYHYRTPSHSQNFRFFTPMLGGLLGIMLLALGIGAILWSKWLMPEEEFVQERHDEVQPGEPEQQVMTGATLMSGINDTGLPRRGLLVRTLFLAGGALATVPLVALIGGMLEAPRKSLFHTLFRPEPLKFPNGIPIVYSDGRRVSPNDMQPGSIVTVFPGVPGGVQAASSPRAPRSTPARARAAGAGRTSSPTPRSARTPAARPRCTSSRPLACCARATNRSSRCSRTPSRCLVRRRAVCLN